MSHGDALSDLGDRAQAKVDAELAGVKAKHPSSDGLRAYADWLDQYGANVGNVNVYGWMRENTPAALAKLRRDFGGLIEGIDDVFPRLHAKFDGTGVNISFRKEQAFTRRVVQREEFVPPEAQS